MATLLLCLAAGALVACAGGAPRSSPPPPGVRTAVPADSGPAVSRRNERIRTLAEEVSSAAPSEDGAGYVVGPGDLLDVRVFGAPELSGDHRVSPRGEISVSLLGPTRVEGLSSRAVEDTLERALRERYMNDPHVTVQVLEMQSHGVSVVGAVNSPGVYQVSGATTLLDVLARAEGLAENAGGTVVVTRGTPAPGSSASQQVNLKELLATGDLSLNVPVQAGDAVKVPEAGIVYVTGEVEEPGGFPIENRETVTALQALALGGGLTGNADANDSFIIRVDESGQRQDIPIDLNAVLEREAEDPVLLAGDVLFVPTSGGKSFLRGLGNALLRMVTLRAIF